jgi:competence protein ComEC
VATFPILLAIGGSVGPHTVVANVVVTPVAAVVPLLGLLAAGLEFAGLPGAPVAAVGRFLSEFVLWVAGWDGFPDLPWVSGWPGVVLATLVTATALTIGRRRLVAVCGVLVAAVALTADFADGWPPARWWLVACDVGQGDGFVMRSHSRVVVVDTGPDPVVMDRCLHRLGVRDIDLLVLTHFHADHAGGLTGALRGRRVGQVWISPCQEPAEQSAAAAPALSGLPVAVPLPGQQVQVGGLTVTVVWPQRIIQAGSVPNNSSVSFVASGEQGSVVFLADVEPEAQAQILRTADLDVDIVKVPHHGSAQFIEALPAAVTPRVALVGVGEGNPFGHPSPEAVGAWQGVGAVVYTTEDNGDIAVVDDLEVVVRPASG